MIGRPRGTLNSNGLPAQIIDLLALESGWWTTAEILDRFGAYEANTVRTALHRLRRQGHLISQPNPRWIPGYERAENEWRVA